MERIFQEMQKLLWKYVPLLLTAGRML